VDELRPIWEKIDDHQRAINEHSAWRQTTEYRISQMETRFDQSIKDNARAFGELAHTLKEVSKEVSEIHSEQMRQMGRFEALKDAKKESADWKRWLVPALISGVALLAALGIIQGPNG
jgi:phage portal protein BeeE